MTFDMASSTGARPGPEAGAPLVDVVIPVFNGVSTVESAISSIQAQTATDIRIIVVNDGSTDGTRQVVERLAAADGRIMLVDRPNGGIVDALNAGLARCTAAIIARHDADDLANPDRFERQLAFLRDHPGCIAVSGAVRPIDGAGKVTGRVLQLPSPDLADFNEVPQREPYLMHPFLMMRRAAVEAVGGYRHVHHAEDTDLYWRLAEIGPLANMPDLLGDLRIHGGSITAKSVLNGRILALNSQLSGISASRRRAGRADLDFPQAALSDYQQARSPEGVIRAGSRALDAAEAAHLAPAVCAKLLELASHRLYELDAGLQLHRQNPVPGAAADDAVQPQHVHPHGVGHGGTAACPAQGFRGPAADAVAALPAGGGAFHPAHRLAPQAAPGGRALGPGEMSLSRWSSCALNLATDAMPCEGSGLLTPRDGDLCHGLR